jgi:hypothetical protein
MTQLYRTSTVGAVLLAALGILVAAGAAEAQGGPFKFVPVPPCRIVDTREAAGPTGGPALAANTDRSFPIRGFCGVPVTAQAVVLNVTVATPTDVGDLRIFPAGTAAPLASVINWLIGDLALANGAIIPLGDDGGGNHAGVHVDMPAGSPGTVHLILDATGYFE